MLHVRGLEVCVVQLCLESIHLLFLMVEYVQLLYKERLSLETQLLARSLVRDDDGVLFELLAEKLGREGLVLADENTA